MTENLINITVIWRCDEDDFLCTLLQYEDSDDQRQAMQQWSVQDYVEQAYDAEYPELPNPIAAGASYECIAIFEGLVRYIY